LGLREWSIESIGLTKEYPAKEKPLVAVDQVDLLVRSGELFGLLGPNGAGKTTFIKMLCTLVLPTDGTAKVGGYDIVKESHNVRESIGWLHGETGGRALYWRLSARDNLRFYAYIQNVPPSIAQKRIEALLEFFDLQKEAGNLVKDYSTGMKVRVMLARTLLPNPPILLLDEPTVGLDAQTAIETRKLILTLSRELRKTILLTSHNLYEVEKLCERVAIINSGKIIALGTMDQLGHLIREAKTLEVRLDGSDGDTAVKSIRGLGFIRRIVSSEKSGEGWVIRAEVSDLDSAIPNIAQALARDGFKIRGILEIRPNLEEIFVKLTEGNNHA
jgi:ABC-2 type transport system ATP-binding protein